VSRRRGEEREQRKAEDKTNHRTCDFFDGNLIKAIQEGWDEDVGAGAVSCVFEFPTCVDVAEIRSQASVN
jgi:hypothetical protein